MDFWSNTQEQFANTVNHNWYNQPNDTNYAAWKHLADMMIYYGTDTQMDKDSNPIPGGTNYDIDVFTQNYNTDWWYFKKYTYLW
jgi:hypothetical protein